mgnify:CR=1 FL=1
MILSANNACDGRKQFYAREAPKLGKKKKYWSVMKKLLQADELLVLYTEASVECAVLLFQLLIKNHGIITSAAVFLEHITVKR